MEPDREPEQPPAGAPESTPAPLRISGSRHFVRWLARQNGSLAFTTYRTGKLFFVGLSPEGGLSLFERTFNRCMGLCAAGPESLWMSSLFQLWRLENALEPGRDHDGFDRLYVPRVAYTTGDLDVHDIAVDGDGRVVFVNTLFSCLATVSDRHSFVPLWVPPFISRLAAEDRCHLNGLALQDGVPRYASAVGSTDVADGWRDRRHDGGVLVDVQSGEVVVSGLSMPHSPRVYRDRLWLLESGRGRFGFVDPASGRFEPVAFCPGYLRGLAFCGDHAVTGLSRPRDDAALSGLPLDDELQRRNAEPRCGLQVIDLASGDVQHWLRIEGIVQELYDVVFLPGVRRPMALGLKTDEICRIISVPPDPDPA